MYISLRGNGVGLLMKRDFAPERLRQVIARMRNIEPLLNSMSGNVGEPPREFTELASRIADSSVTFFRDTVANWARQSAGADSAVFAEFQTVNRKVVTALQMAADYLRRDLLPHSIGNYSIGVENYRRKLEYEEMVDTPLDRLLAIGVANLDEDYKAFVETAKQIDPGRSAADIMRSISNDHPTGQGLMDFAKATVENIRKFVIEKRIISIPSDVRLSILPTPPYARTGSFASMDTPGAFERRAKEAFYYITPVEADWTAARKQEHLRLYNRPVMDIITIHEAYPGHYVQFLYAKHFPTKTRKLLYCGSNAEGWAHYAERIMVEEGFGGGDPKIRQDKLETSGGRRREQVEEDPGKQSGEGAEGRAGEPERTGSATDDAWGQRDCAEL